jgi:hypothetical protein
MNWLFWNALTPIFGPLIISLIIVLAFVFFSSNGNLMGEFKWIFTGGRIKVLTSSRGMFYFAVVSLFQSRYLQSSTNLTRIWWLETGTTITLVLCFIGLIAFTVVNWNQYKSSNDGKTDALPPTHVVVAGYIVALLAACVGFLTYLWSNNLLP